jgi:hypothetical protein
VVKYSTVPPAITELPSLPLTTLTHILVPPHARTNKMQIMMMIQEKYDLHTPAALRASYSGVNSVQFRR